MTPRDHRTAPFKLPRISTGINGLDLILDGGLIEGMTFLIAGPAGSGKTTLGNHIGFHHARQGGTTIFATVLAESHDRLLRRLQAYEFFDAAMIGESMHYVSLFDSLDEGGFDGLLIAIRDAVRSVSASLLVIDGMSLVEDMAGSSVELRRFIQRLQALIGLLDCTCLLLTSRGSQEISAISTHTEGVALLDITTIGFRDIRSARVAKMRGSAQLLGRHHLAVSSAGVEIHPRLEAWAGHEPPVIAERARLGTGVSGLDLMLGGGLLANSSTMVLGTPGAGKTILGLQFLAAGVDAGEPGMIATFHETPTELSETAANCGIDLATSIERGIVRTVWSSPVELSADAWAWHLLEEIERHQPQRLVIDGLADIERMLWFPDRVSDFFTALVNELRSRGITTLINADIDAFANKELPARQPSASTMMQNGILIRTVEQRSSMRRLISILKARQSDADPLIREFRIGSSGIVIGDGFEGDSHMLTGTASGSVQAPSIGAC